MVIFCLFIKLTIGVYLIVMIILNEKNIPGDESYIVENP